MNEQESRIQMVEVARSLFERGYATGGAGNLSLKLDNGLFIATPTGSSLGRLTPEELSLVDINGKHISGEKPSKEVEFHLAIYRNDEACNAIVHLHCTHLTALSCLTDLDYSNAIQPFTPYYVMRVGTLPVIPYYKPGDPQIAKELGKRAGDFRAFLLANHGPVVTGVDMYDAVDNAEELEETAKLYFLLQNSKIKYLSEDEISQLKGGNK